MLFTPRRILVVRTDRLGDVVLATPLIRALRQTFPHAFLAAMVRPYARDILLHNPHLNAILVDDYEGADRGRRGFFRQVKKLWSYRFDTALLLLPTERAAWMLFFAGIPRRVSVGYKFYGVITGMRGVSRHKYIPLRHEADYSLDLGRKIGVRSDDLSTEVFLTGEERKDGRRVLREAGVHDSDILIGIHPGSGGSTANWEPKRYAMLAALLLEKTNEDVRLVITGEEQAVAFPSSHRLLDLRGKRPLRSVMSVLSHLDVFFSSSTGPMHIAAALRVPTVSIFCPLPASSPTLWGPQGNDARIILPPEGYCQGRCPGIPKICRLEEITIEKAAETLLTTIADARHSGAIAS
jgi:heptosyltransferase-2